MRSKCTRLREEGIVLLPFKVIGKISRCEVQARIEIQDQAVIDLFVVTLEAATSLLKYRGGRSVSLFSII